MTGLTVVMPVYNAMPHLPTAVESILAQGLTSFDFLIIDDGSSDGSWEYLTTLRDSRVRLERYQHAGLQPTLNRSLELVDTMLYARMDADDIATPDRLEKQCTFMAEHPDVVLAGSQVNYLTEQTLLSGPLVPVTHAEIVKSLLSGRAAIRHPTCMMRTRALREVGGYRLPYSEDHDLFLRMSEQGRVANLPARLLNYRIRTGSAFLTHLDKHQAYRHYSIECYRSRALARPEPALATFMENWRTRGVVDRLVGFVDAWSAFQYRRALIDLGQGNVLRASARLLLAIPCRPRDCWRNVVSRRTRWLGRPLEAKSSQTFRFWKISSRA